MVQKILNNEIIDKYKVNRCIPKKPEKIINNNLIGGLPIGEDSGTLAISFLPFGYRVIVISIFLILLGFVLKANPNNLFGAGEISNGKVVLVILVGVCIIIIDWFINVSQDTSLDKKDDSLQNKILYSILGSEAKITTFHTVILFSVAAFIIFIIINILAILLIKLLKGDSDTCLKNLKLSRLKPLHILPDNSVDTQNALNQNGIGRGPLDGNPPQRTNITVDKDYFDLNNFIKPALVTKENTVSQNAGIIFNPNNINVPGQVNQPPVPAAGANAALINIGQGNNNQGSIFDNRIKVVEKDIYQENKYFKTQPLALTQKLKKYFQYIYDKTEKRQYKIKDYIVDLVNATRAPEEVGIPDLQALIENGASPRATIFLLRAAKGHAFLRGRSYVTPEDVKTIGSDILRHRIVPSYEAEAEEMDSDALIGILFDHVEVP